ncbi:hypothetical protein [Halomonas sp. I5-271120]|uniref:hypothetical protein n=1 Tax=Halomonas sp. I5-271120 TaxID=3061632 RepID=UPI0027147BD9|nr:hypothetical protein [Halomonas sp. I5-271120]
MSGKVLEDARRYARVSLDEGSHDIVVRGFTDYGETAEQVETIEVVANKPPTCEMSLSESSTSWRYRSDCNDTDGRVQDYEWTLNGEVIGLTSYGLSISKGQFEQKPEVQLRSLDDSGDYLEPVTKSQSYPPRPPRWHRASGVFCA